MADLTLGCVLTWPGGTLQLENEAGGYSLEVEALAEVVTSWRRHEVSNQWVEGAFTVGAVKENVSLPLHVYVTGTTAAELQARLSALTGVLDRLAFDLAFTESGVTTTWKAQVADYTVSRPQALRVAREALVKATVPASPTATVVAA